MRIELLGGVLDGKELSADSVDDAPPKMVFRNPSPITYQSDLDVSLRLTKVCYIRTHVNNGTIYYRFGDYME